MRFKKILAGIAAGAMVVSSLVVPTIADDVEITAVLGFADADWSVQDWTSSVTVTGDGTYTLTSTDVAGADGLLVFIVDLADMCTNYPDATATLDSVAIDGTEVEVDGSKVLYGDIEGAGNYRIEIYNEYGNTKIDAGIDDTLSISESVAVTFKVSGTGVDAGTSTDDPDTSTDDPDTSTDDPDTSTDDPDTSTDDPDTSADDPGTSADDPGTSSDDPDTSSNDPDTSSNDPGTSSNDPDATEDYVLGDVNQDGEIDYLDAMTVLRYDAELIDLSETQRTAGDTNGDGYVDSLDAILILRYDADLISSFES